MNKILYFGLLGLVTSKILLHENLGLSLEIKENVFIQRKTPITTNVLVPLSVHVPSGPYEAESNARIQTEFSKIIQWGAL